MVDRKFKFAVKLARRSGNEQILLNSPKTRIRYSYARNLKLDVQIYYPIIILTIILILHICVMLANPLYILFVIASPILYYKLISPNVHGQTNNYIINLIKISHSNQSFSPKHSLFRYMFGFNYRYKQICNSTNYQSINCYLF